LEEKFKTHLSTKGSFPLGQVILGSNRKTMISWNFFADDGQDPSTNIKRLLNTLSFKTLEFMTDDFLDERKNRNELFNIGQVSMTGTVMYVKWHLSNSVEKMKELIKKYCESEESLENKVYELSLSRLLIKEFFLNNNQHDPVLLNTSFTLNLNSSHHSEPDIVRWDQCLLSESARKEIYDHQHLRHAYITLLDSYLAVCLDNIYLAPLLLKKEVPDNENELQLLEVWIGLKETGFLKHLTNDKEIASHRKAFFELFQLNDRNYISRNRGLKKRNSPVARFLPKMIDCLEKYYKGKK